MTNGAHAMTDDKLPLANGWRLVAVLLVLVAGCMTPAAGRGQYRLRAGIPGPDGKWKETWVDERVEVGQHFAFGEEGGPCQVAGRITLTKTGVLHFTGTGKQYSNCIYDTDVVLGDLLPPDVCTFSGIADYLFIVIEEVPPNGPTL